MGGIISISGTYGGRLGPAVDGRRVQAAHRLLRGESLGTAEFFPAGFPRAVGIVVNTTCNLRCRHCYLELGGDTGQTPLEPSHYERLLAELADRPEVQLISIVGKEPLLGTVGPAVIQNLGRVARDLRPNVRTGAITNATLAHRHRDLLLEANLSYLDVSVDGTEEDHDVIRGKGAFERARPNIEWLTRTFGDRVFASLTVQRVNARRLPQAAQVLHDLGVETVGVAFYTPTPVTDPLLALERSDTEKFFSTLELLDQLVLDHPLAVQLDINCAFPPGLLWFLNSPWAEPGAWTEDCNGSLYNQYTLRNGLELQFRMTLWPQPFADVARVNADGKILLGEDALNTTLYSQNALASLADFGFELKDAWTAAARSPRFKKVVDSWSRTLVPLLQETRAAEEVLHFHGALPCAA